ncbi:MAG: helix-turn-helix transcriptional regulator [Solirubrobacterales bacterium]
MAYPAYIREKARQLRTEKKLTIDELAERLAIPRTTIFGWVRDIEISRKPNCGWPESARSKGTRRMQAKYRDLREAAYEDALLFYVHLCELPSFRDFLVLFITEGHRRSRHRVSIANSDPAVVKLAARWMHILSANHLTFSVQYHADQRLAEIQAFWGAQLAIAPGDIRLQRKSNSGQLGTRTWRSKHGVLTVTADDTYFREAMQAWTDCLKDTWLDSSRFGA